MQNRCPLRCCRWRSRFVRQQEQHAAATAAAAAALTAAAAAAALPASASTSRALTRALPRPPAPLQGAAVEVAARLDEALAQPRASSAALKSVLSKAEAAAAAAATSACQFAVGAELLQPRIQVRGGAGAGSARLV